MSLSAALHNEKVYDCHAETQQSCSGRDKAALASKDKASVAGQIRPRHTSTNFGGIPEMSLACFCTAATCWVSTTNALFLKSLPFSCLPWREWVPRVARRPRWVVSCLAAVGFGLNGLRLKQLTAANGGRDPEDARPVLCSPPSSRSCIVFGATWSSLPKTMFRHNCSSSLSIDAPSSALAPRTACSLALADYKQRRSRCRRCGHKDKEKGSVPDWAVARSRLKRAMPISFANAWI
jgi:hypothetical protein